MASRKVREEVAALRQSTEGRLSVVDGVLRSQARYRRFRRAGLAALLLLAVFAGLWLGPSSRPSRAGFTGYDWQVVAISHDGKVTSIPARMHVALQFSPGGQFGANDSVNFHSGTYRTTSDGFTTSDLISTLVGYAGYDPAVQLAIGAIESFDNGAHATVKLTADRLVVGVGSYTLTCERGATRADALAPAGTGE